MHEAARGGTGALYRMDHDRKVTRVLDGLGIPNSLAWSPDGDWNAEFNGWRLVRYSPGGHVDMPVQSPTCCTFGGPDLSTRT